MTAMTSNEIKSFIIPGYHGLTRSQKQAFQGTEDSGRAFLKLVRQTDGAFAALPKPTGFLASYFATETDEEKRLHAKLAKDKAVLINQIKSKKVYQSLQRNIAIKTLQGVFPDLAYLSNPDKITLCSTPFVQDFTTQLLLGAEKESLLRAWETNFLTHRSYEDFRNRIIDAKFEALARALPMLNDKKSEADEPWIAQLKATYVFTGESLDIGTKPVREALANIFFNYLKEANQAEIEFIDLYALNRTEAEKMANAALDAFRHKQSINPRQWLDNYEAALFTHLQAELKQIAGKTFVEPTYGNKSFLDSLSSLWPNYSLQNANETIGKIADAHAFIQATNFSTQNENSLLALLDVYNYVNYYERIYKTKLVILGLLEPFRPIITEYINLGLYEKNTALKFIKSLIPIVITVGTMMALNTLVMPFILPELIFAAAFVPELLIGLAVTSSYITIKNSVYNTLRNAYYGGFFNIPEFQVNERMIEAFGEEKAKDVRSFYINAFVVCDELEKHYQTLADKITLTQDDIEARKQNMLHRNKLHLEWFDIHSNGKLGRDKLPEIVLNRLAEEIKTEYARLETTVQAELSTYQEAVHALRNDLQDTFVKKEAYPVTRMPNYQPGLFKPPHALEHKFRTEELLSLAESIETVTPKNQ